MKGKLILALICAVMLTACGKSDAAPEGIHLIGEDLTENADSNQNDSSDDRMATSKDASKDTSKDASDDSSSDVSDNTIQAEMAAVEQKSLEFEQADWDTMAQQEMNIATGEWYALWDDELNSLWSRLSDELDPEAKEKVLAEQREWITTKEEHVKAAGEQALGGSLQPQLENTTAKCMTHARAYVLAGYLADARGESFEIPNEVQTKLDDENPSLDATFELFEGVWPIFDSEDGVIGIQKIDESDFAAADFDVNATWVIWYTRGGVMTDCDVVDYTPYSITLKSAGIYYKMEENMAGEIELYYGDSPDAMEMLFMADKSYN